MNRTSRSTIAAIAVAAVLVPVGIAAAGSSDDHHDHAALSCGSGLFGDELVRTELFFGLSRPRGRISEHQFGRFVDEQVTPRFPDGLTLLSGRGQFRLDDGEIVEEGSKVLVLLHDGEDVSMKEIEEIRAEYVEQFEQQSVLRTDEPSCVSF